MRRLLWVARHEYMRHARRRGFLLATFGLPLLVIGGLVLLILVLFNTFRPEAAIGYVDPAAGEDALVPLRPFQNETAARAALDAGEVDAYAVIPADYPATGTFTVYGGEPPSSDGRETLQAALDRGLLARSGVSSEVAARALDPLGEVEARRPDGAVVSPQLLIGRGAVAVLGSLLFVLTVFSSASYLLQALVEEKENRTMEIVTTSIAPFQLIGGKTLGLGLLGLTSLRPLQLLAGKVIGLGLLGLVQVGVWLASGALLLGLSGARLPSDALATVPWAVVALALVAFVLGYLVYGSLLAAVGATVTAPAPGHRPGLRCARDSSRVRGSIGDTLHREP